MKSTGHEKVRVSVCLTVKSDGTKLKPFIVFKGAKRDSKALNEQYKSRCVVASTSNGWMNTDLTQEFVKTVLGTFSFGKGLLAWDSFECYMESSVIKSLGKTKIDHVIIPGGILKGKVNTTSEEQSHSSLKLIYRRLQLKLVFRQVPI